MKPVKGQIKNAVLIIETESGEHVQRPIRQHEQHFILPLLAELDGGTLKVVPVEGIAFTKPEKKK